MYKHINMIKAFYNLFMEIHQLGFRHFLVLEVRMVSIDFYLYLEIFYRIDLIYN